MPIEIVPVPAFNDNYLWLAHDPESGSTAVVDPGDGEVVLAAAAERGWIIDKIFNTHWHPDHTGGNRRVKEAIGATLYGPAAEGAKIAGLDVPLREGDRVRIGKHEAEVWEVPGHTLGHIAYVFRDDGLAFVGDTLFAMGCGRLFEGTAAQMFHSLGRIAELPEATRLYPAHEYTLSNARFSAHAAPGDAAVAQRLEKIAAMRDRGEITLPTTVSEERATNLFVRAGTVEEFARLRTMKDNFA
ncbi:hydroxyacylglutathione hydrolase [Sphingomonas sp. HDW15A]|uniref:hydroxyacylglutathione hydrolase n=1 Tax=Sphingomonas sp. HDW15A TaxID=2714942 RepID=UPI001409601E|nr:hydroxyacylglutathione hydrolase [Sphingomonas sp. HDW15A]QIK96861.1 hydroxyacylglutathione hydrolase [Sphingomonas sp. HDW15A]